MTTLVGKQQEFSKAIVSLLELEFDAYEAYLKVLEKLDNKDQKEKIRSFASDHDRHIKELIALLQKHDISFTPGPDMKQWLTKGKVVLANLIGDKSILFAMYTNEIDTYNAYDNMLGRDDIWDDAQEILMNAKKDEVKHKSWFEEQVK